MKLCHLSASQYRSLKSIRLDIEDVNLFVGDNGAGKSNLYRALFLARAAAEGSFAAEIAGEGGMASVLWSGTRGRGPVRLHLETELRDEDAGLSFIYAIDAGLKPPAAAGFPFEPQIKSETLHFRHGMRRPIVALKREGPALSYRDDAGRMAVFDDRLLPSESALAVLGGSGLSPEATRVRDTLLRWRFYHGFRSDALSPLRQPCLAVTAPMLAMDGSDLAAVFATLVHIRGDTVDLDRAVADAFKGAELAVPVPGTHAEFGLVLPEFPQRTFSARELSDGQIRFLALAGALLSYRLPSFIALNEPEASLHPDMLPALAAMIARAAYDTQIWIVTHSPHLAELIEQQSAIRARRVVRQENGATWIEGMTLSGAMEDDLDD